MATVTLEYNPQSIEAQKTLEYILSMGFFKTATSHQATRKSRIEQSLEDIDNGDVFFLAGPAKR